MKTTLNLIGFFNVSRIRSTKNEPMYPAIERFYRILEYTGEHGYDPLGELVTIVFVSYNAAL
jgi:hypothetical protein